MKKVSLIFILLIGFGCISYAQRIAIGAQVWMTKNLDVATFRNGDPIPQAKTNEEWVKAGDNQQPAWCYYDNDPANGTKYGKLYNWYAVNDSRGLVPVGYHIPSDAEWKILTDFLGGEEVAGKKMKNQPNYEIKIRFVEEGGYDETKWVSCNNCSYWTQNQKANNPCNVCRNQETYEVKTGKYIPKTKRKIEDKINIGWTGTNESGFSGLPGGPRSPMDHSATLASTVPGGVLRSTGQPMPGARNLHYSNGRVPKYYYSKEKGFSVRCLWD